MFKNTQPAILLAVALGAAWTAQAGWEDVGAPVRRQGGRAMVTTQAPRTAAPQAATAAPRPAAPARQPAAPRAATQYSGSAQGTTSPEIPRTVREAAQRRAAREQAEARARAAREQALIDEERRRIDANTRRPLPPREARERALREEARRGPRDDSWGGNAFFLPFFDTRDESGIWLHGKYFTAAKAPNGNELKMAEAEAHILLVDAKGFLGGDLEMSLEPKAVGFIDDADYETLPRVLSESAIDVQWVWRFVNDVSLELGGRPGLYGDVEDFDAAMFGYPLRGALYYSFSPELAIRGGAEVRPGWDMAVMPIVGLSWAPSEYFLFEPGLPKLLARIHLGPLDIYGVTEWHNATYSMEDKGAKPEDLTIDDWRLGGGINLDLALFSIGAEAGYVMGREFKAEGSKGSGKIEIEDSPYFGVTLGSRF